MPVGMINDILSAISPQAALLLWNITIHTERITSHITAPMPDNITSETLN